jgi:hypothetical protein
MKRLMTVWLIVTALILLVILSGCTNISTELIEKYPELKYCNNIDKESLKRLCVSVVAESKLNEDICLGIESERRDFCYESVAVAKGDQKPCENVKHESNKQECYLKVAKEREDTTVCERISDEQVQKSCNNWRNFKEAITNDEEEKCELVKDDFNLDISSSLCYISIAVAKNEASICNNIKDYSYKNSCYVKLFKATKDEGLCLGINDKSSKNLCLKEAAKEKRDERICEKIEGKGYKDECYTELAAVKKDFSICDKRAESTDFDKPRACTVEGSCEHPRTYFLNECRSNVPDEEFCNSLVNKGSKSSSKSNFRDNCFKKLAEKKQNSQYCEQLNFVEERDECYASTALVPETCKKINNEHKRRQCFEHVAKLTKNGLICNEIDNPKLRNRCLFNVMCVSVFSTEDDIQGCSKKGLLFFL